MDPNQEEEIRRTIEALRNMRAAPAIVSQLMSYLPSPQQAQIMQQAEQQRQQLYNQATQGGTFPMQYGSMASRRYTKRSREITEEEKQAIKKAQAERPETEDVSGLNFPPPPDGGPPGGPPAPPPPPPPAGGGVPVQG